MKLDLIFSIGPACRPAYHLKSNFLRVLASPLDWQMDYSLDTCLHLFETKFNTFFSEIKVVGKGVRNNRKVLDTLNTITSIHHFDSDLPILVAKEEFRNLMQKRYDRLHNAISAAHTVGLICNRPDSLDKFTNFLYSFGELYPNTEFLLINIRNVENCDSIRMKEYSLNSRLTIREYSVRDKYIGDDPEAKNWLGNIEAWNSILQDYQLNSHPFVQYVKNATFPDKPVILYGAGLYCQKLIDFLAKYSVKVSKIIVTSLNDNPSFVNGIPVMPYCQESMHSDNELIIISVTDEATSLEIYDMLTACGHGSVIRINRFLRIIS